MTGNRDHQARLRSRHGLDMGEKMSCCARPSIQPMDYKFPIFANPDEQVTKINRICLRCFAHWFGVDGDVKQYTRKEWDELMEHAFDADKI